jgi:hypothetical protein
MLDNRFHERKLVAKEKINNGFLNQFDQLAFDNAGEPVSSNAVFNDNGTHSGMVRRMENERELALNGGYSNFGEGEDMTYGVVDKEHFNINATPFFKSKELNPLRTQHAGEISQRKMELYTGLDDRTGYSHKKEQKPLFSEVTNITNIYGTPNMTDYFESRYMPSKERRNEKLFQPIKVTKGIGLGANEQAKFGYHDPVRILPKSTDEIRPPSKGPKTTYKGVIVEGQKGSKGPIIGKTMKRKPVAFRENGPKDMVRNGGEIRAPAIYGEIQKENLATQNRGVLRRIQYGPGKHIISQATPTELKGKVQETTRKSFKQAEPRNIQLVDKLQSRPDHEPYVPRATQRVTENNYIGPIVGSDGRKNTYVDPIGYIPEITMREIHSEYDRAGNVVGNAQKEHFFDPNDVPDQNMRNVHSEYDRAGVTNGNNSRQKTHYYDATDVPDQNMRNVHSEYDRAGSTINGDRRKVHYYDATDVPDQNMRNVHSEYDRAGATVNGGNDRHKVHYYDSSDVPDQNMRNVHSEYDRAGSTVSGDRRKVHHFDPSDVPDQNMRNVHSEYDRAGSTVSGDRRKVHHFDPSDVPDQNMRNVHSEYNRAGSTVGDKRKVHYYDATDVPDQNMRNVHSEYDRVGVAVNNINKGKRVDHNDVPDLTQRNTYNYDDVGAVTGLVNKNKRVDYNDVPDLTQRNTYNHDDVGAATGLINKNKRVDYNDVPDLVQRNTYNYDDVGIAGSQINKNKRVDYNDVPDLVQRNTYNYDDVGVAGSHINKNKRVDYNDVPDLVQRNTYNHDDVGVVSGQHKKHIWTDYNDIPDITMRETTAHTNHYNPAGKADGNGAQRRRYDIENAVTNSAKEEIAKGRAPTLINYNKGPTIQFTEYDFCTNRDIKNERTPNMQNQYNKNGRLRSMETSTKQIKWFETNDNDAELLEDTLDHNPLINNVVHKAHKIGKQIKY